MGRPSGPPPAGRRFRSLGGQREGLRWDSVGRRVHTGKVEGQSNKSSVTSADTSPLRDGFLGKDDEESSDQSKEVQFP